MRTILRRTGKLSFSLLFILSLSVAGMVCVAQPAAGGQAAQTKKKKLPPGSKGFAQFAGRDASDKLITGGGTRGGEMTEPGTPPPSEADKAYAEAIQSGTEHYENGEYKEAVESFKKAIAAKPEQFVAYYSLGVSYEALNMFKDAMEAYKRAITLKPAAEHQGREVLAYFNLGNIHAAAGQHKEAVEVYRQVLQRHPNLWMVHYNMGLSQAALGQQKDAINSFTKALDLKPDRDAELIHYNMGLAYGNDEQYEKAAAAFKQALTIKSGYAEARYNLGLVYYMLDNQSALIEQHKILQTAKPEMASELAKLIGK